MSELSQRIRASLAALPVRFSTADAFAACPYATRAAVSGVLTTMVKHAELSEDGLVSVALAINGAGTCGQRRRVQVRRFVRAESNRAIPVFHTPSIDITVIDEPVNPSNRTYWEDGAKLLAAVLTRWPGSPLPEEYAR